MCLKFNILASIYLVILTACGLSIPLENDHPLDTISRSSNSSSNSREEISQSGITTSIITNTNSPPTHTPDSSQISTPTAQTLILDDQPSTQLTHKTNFPFTLPISPPGRNVIDHTYRFGSTQGGKREPHHGVEFLNSIGTPVLAAAEGIIVKAGEDWEAIFGPFPNFYGQFVVIQHELSGIEVPVFTLYAHLSEILVVEQQTVRRGQIIGKVGSTGAALGSHLHFEVRIGENDYEHSSNPELWLQYQSEETERLNGAIAGRVLDSNGAFIPINNIVIKSALQSEEISLLPIYLETYQDATLLGKGPWEENFAVGNLPPGLYEISIVLSGIQKQLVEVHPGKITKVTLNVED